MLSTSLSDIQDNLDAIKEKEGSIAISVNNGEASKAQIDADIEAIYSLMLENKQKIASLEAQLRKSNARNAELKKIIAVLEAQIEKQNAEIERLQNILAGKDIEIAYLTEALIRLSGSVDSLAVVQNQTSEALASATEQLQTAYYVMGEKSTLKELGVLTSDGIFSKKVSADSDNSVYTEVNITNFTSLDLGTKKAKLLSQHPTGSFELNEGEDGILTLVITDTEKFWSHSKYLVVQTK